MNSNPLRRTAQFAALGSAIAGGAAVLGAAAVVGFQVAAAKHRPGIDPRSAPDLPDRYGDSGNPLVRLIVLGDSLAASVGASSPANSLGARIATAAAKAGYHVQARSVAVANSHSGDVKVQTSRALITSESDPYDVALIVAGSMDACAWTSLDEIYRTTFRSVTALRNAGVAVVLVTAPDLGAATCVSPPLRNLWGWRSRKVAREQVLAVTEAGGTAVDLPKALGAAFTGDPTLLAPDGFHPSDAGYRAIADAVTPAVLAAIGSVRERA